MSEEDKNVTFGTVSKLYDDIVKLNRTNAEIFKANETLTEEIERLHSIIKEVREDLDKQITFCTNEADGTINDKYCRIALNYLKHLKQILDKENK